MLDFYPEDFFTPKKQAEPQPPKKSTRDKLIDWVSSHDVEIVFVVTVLFMGLALLKKYL